MKQLFIVDLESIESRYTCQWKWFVPEYFRGNLKNTPVTVIDGGGSSSEATDGGFLNFLGTNRYKSNQVNKMVELFEGGKVQNGDRFLFTDAWHPGIINLKYMASLSGVEIEIHGLWHAGNYDPSDWLGNHFGEWAYDFERSLYGAIDFSWFATEFHRDMFVKNLDLETKEKTHITGWPMGYMENILSPFTNIEKKDQVVFPHRLAPEKQPEVAKMLEKKMPHVNFVFCQEQKLTKDEYHRVLAESKIIFSANLQETLGITVCSEGPLVGCIPIAPDRLSYSEIFKDCPEFLYPDEWTKNEYHSNDNIDNLVDRIQHVLDNHEEYKEKVAMYLNSTYNKYFTASELLKKLK